MSKKEIIDKIENKKPEFFEMANCIWGNPELPMEEYIASSLQKKFLESEGFTITEIPGLPTAFVAEYGSGLPIIGFTGEYDSLGKLENKPFANGKYMGYSGGHGCGHNLLGVGSLIGAYGIMEAIKSGDIQGTVRYYGTPAEEELTGKPLMAKKGCFDDLSCALSWHPFDLNTPLRMRSLAVYSIKFKFYGLASHAGQAPEMGRSALDALELFHTGVNYLREHIVDKARIHYTITNGGDRPNIVPAYAEDWMFIRAPNAENVKSIFERVKNIARGAALMTDTKMDYEIITGIYDYVANSAIIDILQKNYEEIGLPSYTEEEQCFAKALAETMPMEKRIECIKSFGGNEKILKENIHTEIADFNGFNTITTGSFDLGDVSYITPTAQLAAAAWPLGIPAHTWQSCTSAGSSIGLKAMINAGKILCMSAYDIFLDETILVNANKQFKEYTKGLPYHSLIEDNPNK